MTSFPLKLESIIFFVSKLRIAPIGRMIMDVKSTPQLQEKLCVNENLVVVVEGGPQPNSTHHGGCV